MLYPLLTIVIPTYSRAEHLSLLLTTLSMEVLGLENNVRIIVGDNASTDNTIAVTDSFSRVFPDAVILRHSENVGPDENFCRCVDLVKTRFFWIMGDDDLPKEGVLRQIVDLLKDGDPDILYLNSEWLSRIHTSKDGKRITTLTVKLLSRELFAKKVNVWLTFISGMVVNLDRLYELNPGLNIRRFNGTSLVQLGWVLPLLMTGAKFQIVPQLCILATGSNSGGYKLLTVFVNNFSKILDEICGDGLIVRKNIEYSLLWCFVPTLIWSLRFRNQAAFVDENMMTILSSLKGRVGYWLILLPLAKLYKPLALPFYLFSKILARFAYRLN
jgi:abequosyltransferase